MKIAVVGHVEWGRFARVTAVPKRGEIVHASEYWEEVAGGGSVAAMQIAALNGDCLLYTAVGKDDTGSQSVAQLRQCGVEVYAAIDPEGLTKSAYIHIDDAHERTITVAGSLRPGGTDNSLPWDQLADMDAVYFVSGDAAALRAARRAKLLVATARALPVLQEADVLIDVLVMSGEDDSEAYRPGVLAREPKLVVTTRGVQGGSASDGTAYRAQAVPLNKINDTYGCGDSFAAGLSLALASGSDTDSALQLAAQCGAHAARRKGAFFQGLTLES